jgi:hypothetical protein
MTACFRSGLTLALALAAAGAARSEPFQDRFKPLDELWPQPTAERTASGAPGPAYWQQKVDYRINARLDEAKKLVTGEETITYRNNSPETLAYLWLLLDQNRFRTDALREATRTVARPDAGVTLQDLERNRRFDSWHGGFDLSQVADGSGRPLAHSVVDALMRIDLASPLKPGQSTILRLRWSLPVIETDVTGGRSGYECFKDGNCIFQIGQWFPRLAAYDDQGWHNDPFLGVGEFPLEFGDYEVSVTVPADHVVAATGELQNPGAVLTAAQRARLAQAKDAREPLYVVTPEEALAAQQGHAAGEKTWSFRARNVRDFAFASSRKYMWQAMGVANPGGRPVLASAFFPDEARPLWPAYVVKAMAHALKVWGRFAYPYPYPVVQAANGTVTGYEFPMLSFDANRPTTDPKTGAVTYSERGKTGLVTTIFHETGHNWFPETVNSDERRWNWMDEGLTTFVEYEAQKAWDADFPTRSGEPRQIKDCMTAEKQAPIMVRPDMSPNPGCTAYAKPGTALVVLRETVMGREAFDRAFREYARRWRFKRATPYDFFRTMQDVSGQDLSWFWRDWFYGTGHVDVALTGIVRARIDSRDPAVEKALARAEAEAAPKPLAVLRNTGPTAVQTDPSLADWYTGQDRYAVAAEDEAAAKAKIAAMSEMDRDALANAGFLYRLTFRNVGGVITPIPLKLTFKDGRTESLTIPAHVWRADPAQAIWTYRSRDELVSAEVDPLWETGDTDRSNNAWPGRIETVTVKAEDDSSSPNAMQQAGLRVPRDSLTPVR